MFPKMGEEDRKKALERNGIYLNSQSHGEMYGKLMDGWNMHKVVLRTKRDIEEELMKQPYVKSCKVKESGELHIVDIYIRLSIWDFFFRKEVRRDEIFTLLRPRMPFITSFNVKLRLI